LEKNKYHIICSRLLLIVFVVGQLVLYGHQHKFNAPISKAQGSSQQQTITEKCQLCDAMHHNNMVISHHVYFQPALISNPIYVPDTYDFVSISLILSAGRSPPLS
jgi:hypothetical protein